MHIPDDLIRVAKGEVLDDSWTKQAYSVDASHYEVMPALIVCPADQSDVEQACLYSARNKIPITARGAGTGLLGQSLSDGIILDFTKHMNKIIEIEDNYVVVQPGVIKGILDKELKKRNKFLPPDPASSNYCTIGGMIADNSSGAHCLGYGNTIDFLDAVNLVYADGKTGFASVNRFDERMEKFGRLLSSYIKAIRTGYPKVNKNSCGYRLDSVMSDKFCPHKVLAASEGTLGIVTSATLRILDIPTYRCIMVLGFKDLIAAVSAVPAILEFSPVALEMMDHTVLTQNKSGDSGCLLFVEFAGESQKTVESFESCRARLGSKCAMLEYASDENSLARIWAARKGALNDIMKMTVGSRKPIGMIEDTVVSPQLLVDHASNLLQIYRKNKLDYAMYGHVGDGNVHTRPLVDTSSHKEVALIQSIAGAVFRYVINKGGSITGEHGDGIARVGYIEMMYGKHLADLFFAVKSLFDPDFMMNPGKKVPIK